MASPLFGSGTFASTFRRILLLGFILLFVGLILNARVQYRLAWEDLDRNLESSLVTEGRLLAAWLARALDPIATLDPLYEEWRESASPPPLEDLTGSNWLLLDASGEVAVGSSGEPLFRWIDPATGEIASELVLEEILSDHPRLVVVVLELTGVGDDDLALPRATVGDDDLLHALGRTKPVVALRVHPR